MNADGDAAVVDDLEATSWHAQSKIGARSTFRASFCTMAWPAKGQPMLSNREARKGPSSVPAVCFPMLTVPKAPSSKRSASARSKAVPGVQPILEFSALRIHGEQASSDTRPQSKTSSPPSCLLRRTPQVAWATCKRSGPFKWATCTGCIRSCPKCTLQTRARAIGRLPAAELEPVSTHS